MVELLLNPNHFSVSLSFHMKFVWISLIKNQNQRRDLAGTRGHFSYFLRDNILRWWQEVIYSQNVDVEIWYIYKRKWFLTICLELLSAFEPTGWFIIQEIKDYIKNKLDVDAQLYNQIELSTNLDEPKKAK